jgi:hypothetical protein
MHAAYVYMRQTRGSQQFSVGINCAAHEEAEPLVLGSNPTTDATHVWYGDLFNVYAKKELFSIPNRVRFQGCDIAHTQEYTSFQPSGHDDVGTNTWKA